MRILWHRRKAISRPTLFKPTQPSSLLSFSIPSYIMHFTLLAIAALFLVTSSNALTIDSSLHLARHHLISARHPVVKRANSRRCIERDTTSASQPAPVASSSSPPTSSAAPAAPAPSPSPSPSQAPPSSPPSSGGSGKVGLGWSYGGEASLSNFITSKVSAFVGFSLLFVIY